ncbi:MAG TPA: LysM domain-containing protein [Pseudogracilibacillus sp.]|nr:LysM domain-containing protein [Pseudogracilibacillus sp.]
MKEEKTLLYTVKGGDTLSQIAKDHNTTIAALVRINNIKDKNNHARTTLKAIGEEKRWHLHSQKR